MDLLVCVTHLCKRLFLLINIVTTYESSEKITGYIDEISYIEVF